MHKQCLVSVTMVEYKQQEAHNPKPKRSQHEKSRSVQLSGMQPLLQANTKTISVPIAKDSITITSKHQESICSHTKRFFIKSNGTDNIPMHTRCLASVSIVEYKRQQAYNIKPTTCQHIKKDPCNFNSLPYNHYCKQTPKQYLFP